MGMWLQRCRLTVRNGHILTFWIPHAAFVVSYGNDVLIHISHTVKPSITVGSKTKVAQRADSGVGGQQDWNTS